MESEYIVNIKICNAVSINFVNSESKVCLLRVQVNICGDGCVCITIDPFARRKSSNEIGVNNLLGSLGYGNWEHSRLGVRNQLEALAFFIALDILVNEGMHEWPPIVTLN